MLVLLKIRKKRKFDFFGCASKGAQFLANFCKFFGNRIAMGKHIIGTVSGTAGKTEKSETEGGRKLAKQSRLGREEEEQNESGRRRWTEG